MLSSLAVGLVYTFPFTRTDLSLTMFACITLAINVAITGLIVGRLLYHRQFIQDALGREHGSRYMRIITMCIESAALVVGFNLVLIVLVLVKAQENAALILLQMMAQIYVSKIFLIDKRELV
uniref:Uncharacterized protein n=1 Tax=Psilocybe cubensis TaxID=181762 RepID=A0A8H7XQJ7_PSICU